MAGGWRRLGAFYGANDLLVRSTRFEKVLLSGLSPARQIALSAEASVIALPHGAGLANVLLAPPGLCLVEVFPSLSFKPHFSGMAPVVGGRAAWAAVDFSRPGQLDALAALARELANLP